MRYASAGEASYLAKSQFLADRIKMRVSIISNEDGDLQYSEYIQRHPHSTVYHTLWWRDIIQNEYRFQPVYLLATESGKTVGVMPCFFINNLTGRKLVSVPCSQFGGDLSNDFTVTRAFLSFIEDNQSMIGFSRAAIRFNRQLEAGHESWDIRQHTVMCSINTDSDFEQIKRGFSRPRGLLKVGILAEQKTHCYEGK